MDIPFRKARSLVLLIVALLALSTLVQADEALRDMQGNITTLEMQQASGKWTVVMIWASDCHVCNQEAGQYSNFHTAHANKDAKIIGVSIDGQSGKRDALAFIKRNKVIFPNLIGDIGAISRWYQNRTGTAFRGTPTFILYGPNGDLRATQPGAVSPRAIEAFMASKR